MPLLSSSTLLALLTPCLLSLSYLLITSPTTLLPSPTIYLLGSSMALRPATFPFLLSRDALQKPQFQSQLSSTSTPPNSNTATATITATRELLSLLGLLLATLALILATFSRSLSYSKSDFLSSSTSTSSTPTNSSTLHPSSSDNFNASNANVALGEKLHTLLSAQTLWQTLCAGLAFSSGAVVAFTYLQADNNSSSSGGGGINTARVLANDVVFACCMASMLFWGYLYTVLAEERREVLGWVARRQAEQRG